MIRIRGYYGAGNFGDDALTLVAHRAVAAAAPGADIEIEAVADDYFASLFGHTVRSVRPGTRTSARTMVLGGGGLFHNFEGGRAGARLLEPLLPVLGARAFAKALAAVDRLRGRGEPRWLAHNVAFGLGLGPFAPGSSNRITAAATLAHFAGVAVRDPASLAMLHDWKLDDRAARFTDIVFLRRFWRPAGPAPAVARGRVGVVVRDWKHAPNFNSYLRALPEVFSALRAQGLEPRIIAFDERADRGVLHELASLGAPLVWDPRSMRFGDFCAELASHEVIVSARAHGAIVGACLGVPTVCVAIEPKLHAVARMLEGSAATWESPFEAGALLGSIDAIRHDPHARTRAEAAAARNERAAEDSLEWLRRQLASVA